MRRMRVFNLYVDCIFMCFGEICSFGASEVLRFAQSEVGGNVTSEASPAAKLLNFAISIDKETHIVV